MRRRKGCGPRWALTATNPCPRKWVISTTSHGSRTRSCSTDLWVSPHSMPPYYWFLAHSTVREISKAQAHSIEMHQRFGRSKGLFFSVLLTQIKMPFCVKLEHKKPVKKLHFPFAAKDYLSPCLQCVLYRKLMKSYFTPVLFIPDEQIAENVKVYVWHCTVLHAAKIRSGMTILWTNRKSIPQTVTSDLK